MATKPKLIIANQDTIEFFDEQIEELLNLLGHPEALVTDLSTGLDFISQFEFSSLQEAHLEFKSRLGDEPEFEGLRVEMKLVEMCRIILSRNPNWPNKIIH